jgi:predicted nucleic acid-binding protein
MIIDTMVVAYAMLDVETKSAESMAALRKADELVAPASVTAELVSAFWQWGRDILPPDRATFLCAQAVRLWDALIPVEDLWSMALSLAFERDHSPYDTLFVAAARMRGTKVLTYDRELLKRFPGDTMTIAAFLR